MNKLIFTFKFIYHLSLYTTPAIHPLFSVVIVILVIAVFVILTLLPLLVVAVEQ